MRTLRRMAPALLLALALTACAGSAGTRSPGPADGPLLRPLDAVPADRGQATIEAAFSPQEAAELLTDVPAGLDFGRHAVVCVYLGERPTTGWGLDLQSASLADGELRIRARETRPRGPDGEQRVTFPAGCGLLARAELPAGELAVRADDTISEEFIVSDTLTVPSPSGSP